MIFDLTTRRNSVLVMFIVVTALTLLVTFSRNDIVSLAFTAGIFILLTLFVQLQWRKSGSLVPFAHEDFGMAFFQSVLMFGLIMAARLLIYSVSGDVWEKAAMATLTILTITLYDRFSLYSFGLTLKRFHLQLLWFVVGFALLWFCLMAVNVIGPLLLGQKVTGFEFLPIAFGFSSILLFAKYLLGNFAEEMFFRGFVQTKLKSSSNIWVALFIQASLFALYHVNYIIFFKGANPLGYIGFYLLFTFLFGVTMGAIFELTGSVLVTTLIHACYNLLFVPLYLLPIAKTESGFFVPSGGHAVALGLAAVVCIITIIILKRRKY